jgi:hypothetical protein
VTPELWIALVGAGATVFGVLAALAGIFMGWRLSERTRTSLENRARLARLHALRVEVGRCGKLLKEFTHANVKAPLYRLPTWAGTRALGYVAMDGSLQEGQVHTLLEYYTKVEEVNRGLDYASEARVRGEQKLLDDEYNRLINFKVPGILSNMQEAVERAIEGAIDRG